MGSKIIDGRGLSRHPLASVRGSREVRSYRKIGLVLAAPLDGPVVVSTPEGDMEAIADDYLVTDDPPTHAWPVRREVFDATYRDARLVVAVPSETWATPEDIEDAPRNAAIVDGLLRSALDEVGTGDPDPEPTIGLAAGVRHDLVSRQEGRVDGGDTGSCACGFAGPIGEVLRHVEAAKAYAAVYASARDRGLRHRRHWPLLHEPGALRRAAIEIELAKGEAASRDRYDEAVARGLSDAEAREEGWPEHIDDGAGASIPSALEKGGADASPSWVPLSLPTFVESGLLAQANTALWPFGVALAVTRSEGEAEALYADLRVVQVQPWEVIVSGDDPLTLSRGESLEAYLRERIGGTEVVEETIVETTTTIDEELVARDGPTTTYRRLIVDALNPLGAREVVISGQAVYVIPVPGETVGELIERLVSTARLGRGLWGLRNAEGYSLDRAGSVAQILAGRLYLDPAAGVGG